MSHPRVLIIVSGRINTEDTSNNGLLLRKLFAEWPKESLAQIYSSGDNGDEGFFGKYYKLSANDRRFGRLFYQIKGGVIQEKADINEKIYEVRKVDFIGIFKTTAKRILVDTGIYELIFKPRVSREMLAWIEEFNPDVVFAQGYNLSFTWLPLMVKKLTTARLAFLATDDWPSYLYSGQHGEPKKFIFLMRSVVRSTVKDFFLNIDVPFAFGQPMAEDYSIRYGKKFIAVSHADDPVRFANAKPMRTQDEGVFTILTMGYFNRYRWPLLLDLDKCCQMLNHSGYSVRVTVLSSGIEGKGLHELRHAEFLDIVDDPGDDALPSYLKGADLLVLAEGFDPGWVKSIHLSVSSKSHLYMFARRPIIVYGHKDTGVVKYAITCKWAYVVEERNLQALYDLIRALISENGSADEMVENALLTANTYHLSSYINAVFLSALRQDYLSPQDCLKPFKADQV